VREIASGLQQQVPLAEMKDLVIVMVNLKPRPLAKFVSNGMVVCASNQEHTSVKIIRPLGELNERVVLEGYESIFKAEERPSVLNPKKKVLEKCLEHFKTDGEGYVVWKGIKAKTSGGYLKTEIINGNVL
jgi:aminoacyl tRNA synthase complex-interacting multifunctional protein 1